jgi:pimeloyl-ACP methyl ester carboxylesterase
VPTKIVDGVTVNYHDVGSGQPIVLIHCSSSSHRQWRALWELLQDTHRVIAIDMLDWGGTDTWLNQEGSLIADEVALIHAITSDFDGPFHLVGHSYGGAISYYLAMTAPQRVKSLTLIEPMVGWILDPVEDQFFYDEIRGVAENFWQKFEMGKAEEGINHYFDYWNGEGAWESLDQGLSEYVLDGAQKNYHEFKAIFNGGTDLPAPETFLNPTLLMGGGSSNKPTLRILEILEEKFPDARRSLVEGAGHMSPITHSDQANVIIEEFILR